MFTILLPVDSFEKSLGISTKTSASPAICSYTNLWNSKIQKNVTELLRWTWQ